jgi:hypothetical protein
VFTQYILNALIGRFVFPFKQDYLFIENTHAISPSIWLYSNSILWSFDEDWSLSLGYYNMGKS